jgi:hypothetical protein
MDNSEEFLFVCGIVSFSWVHLLRSECNRLKSVALVLLEDGTNSKARCISGDNEGEERIGNAEDWGASQGGLQGVEGGLCLGGPQVQDVLVCELNQWGCDARIVRDKSMVVVADAKEGLQFFQCLGDWPGLDGLDLLGVGRNALIRDDVAEVGHGGFKELALGDLAIELVLLQEGEDLSDVFMVFGVILAEDQNVVNVHDDRFVEEGVEDILNQGLKGGRGIRETKRHHLVLVMPVSYVEGSLVDVILMDVDLIISPPEVDLGEDFCTKEPVSEIIDERDGEPVLDRDVIEGTVVDAHVQHAIFLFDENHGSTKGGHAVKDSCRKWVCEIFD